MDRFFRNFDAISFWLGFLAGRDAGVRRAVIIDALTPQGISRPSVYRAINDLVASGLAGIVAGLVYVVKG